MTTEKTPEQQHAAGIGWSIASLLSRADDLESRSFVREATLLRQVASEWRTILRHRAADH